MAKKKVEPEEEGVGPVIETECVTAHLSDDGAPPSEPDEEPDVEELQYESPRQHFERASEAEDVLEKYGPIFNDSVVLLRPLYDRAQARVSVTLDADERDIRTGQGSLDDLVLGLNMAPDEVAYRLAVIDAVTNAHNFLSERATDLSSLSTTWAIPSQEITDYLRTQAEGLAGAAADIVKQVTDASETVSKEGVAAVGKATSAGVGELETAGSTYRSTARDIRTATLTEIKRVSGEGVTSLSGAASSLDAGVKSGVADLTQAAGRVEGAAGSLVADARAAFVQKDGEVSAAYIQGTADLRDANSALEQTHGDLVTAIEGYTKGDAETRAAILETLSSFRETYASVSTAGLTAMVTLKEELRAEVDALKLQRQDEATQLQGLYEHFERLLFDRIGGLERDLDTANQTIGDQQRDFTSQYKTLEREDKEKARGITALQAEVERTREELQIDNTHGHALLRLLGVRIKKDLISTSVNIVRYVPGQGFVPGDSEVTLDTVLDNLDLGILAPYRDTVRRVREKHGLAPNAALGDEEKKVLYAEFRELKAALKAEKGLPLKKVRELLGRDYLLPETLKLALDPLNFYETGEGFSDVEGNPLAFTSLARLKDPDLRLALFRTFGMNSVHQVVGGNGNQKLQDFNLYGPGVTTEELKDLDRGGDFKFLYLTGALNGFGNINTGIADKAFPGDDYGRLHITFDKRLPVGNDRFVHGDPTQWKKSGLKRLFDLDREELNTNPAFLTANWTAFSGVPYDGFIPTDALIKSATIVEVGTPVKGREADYMASLLLSNSPNVNFVGPKEFDVEGEDNPVKAYKAVTIGEQAILVGRK